jgi:hypothetical protein
MGLRGSVGLRRKYPGVAGNHPEIAGKLVLEGRVSRVMGHWVTGCTTFAHIWVTGSPEIASPAFSGLVGATHRRIGLHLPQLSRSHSQSLSLSRLPVSISLSALNALSDLPLNRSISLSRLSLCDRVGGTKKKEEK